MNYTYKIIEEDGGIVSRFDTLEETLEWIKGNFEKTNRYVGIRVLKIPLRAEPMVLWSSFLSPDIFKEEK